jgi:hypothetical protein
METELVNDVWLTKTLAAILMVIVVTTAIKRLFKVSGVGQTDDSIIPRKWAFVWYLCASLILTWIYFGHPIPNLFPTQEDPREDRIHWKVATKIECPYKYWQFGTSFGVDTVMPVPACTHYDQAMTLQDELVKLPSRPTEQDKMDLNIKEYNDRMLRYESIKNSSLDGKEQCFMTPRDEQLTLTTTMPYLTTDTMAPSIIEFVRNSPHRDKLLSAPSDGRVDDVFVSRLGETFVRVVAIVKQAHKTNRDDYTLVLKRVLVPLVPLLMHFQNWYDEQVTGAVIETKIDPCQCMSLAGILRSGLYAFYDSMTKRFTLLARMQISDRNEHHMYLVPVKQMPFVDYLNPHPARVHRRLPESLQAPFNYPAKFQISFYNLSSVIMNYGSMAKRVNGMIQYWLPPSPNMTASADHVPLAVVPLNRLTNETKQWIDQDDVTRCIIYCDRLEEEILKSAGGSV